MTTQHSWRRLGAVLLLLIGGIGLAACENTVRGVGRDVQGTGQAVEDTAHGHP